MRFGPSIALAFLAVLTVAAKADTSYPVGGSGGGFSGTGTIYATSNGDGSYTITNITGTGVTGLIGVDGFNGNDNQLFPNSSAVLDGQGFAFTDVNGDTGFQVDMYYSSASNGYEAYILDSDGVELDIPVTFSIDGTTTETPMVQSAFVREMAVMAAPTTTEFDFSYGVGGMGGATDTTSVTPEPSSFALMGTGFLGMAAFLRRRMRA